MNIQQYFIYLIVAILEPVFNNGFRWEVVAATQIKPVAGCSLKKGNRAEAGRG